MSGTLLFIVALIAAGSIVYLIAHFPITSTVFGIPWSPRLTICKLLAPMDIVLTATLLVAPAFSGIQGIMAFACGAIVAAGLTGGVIFIRKRLVPKWRIRYKQEKLLLQEAKQKCV